MTPVPALALGSFEVTPLELAGAYATLANGGARTPVRGVRMVEGRPGGPRTETRAARAPSSTLSPDEAYLVTNLLEGVVDRGTGAGVRALGLTGAVAGKTGTTNDARDAWFAGYSPRLVAVVWVWFDDGTPLGLSGASAALPIWTDFMRVAATVEDPGKFTVPPAVVVRRPCGSATDEVFLAATAPVEVCGAAEPPWTAGTQFDRPAAPSSPPGVSAYRPVAPARAPAPPPSRLLAPPAPSER
jgi:penicillin-binding protein 1B